MKSVLHLASWYPNKHFPFEGDFIRRQAIAVSLFMPVTIVHVTQYGKGIRVTEDKIEKIKSGDLTEIIIYFRFRKINISLIDRIRYNWKYFSVYKNFIRNYFKENGLPGLIHVHIPVKAGIIAGWIKKKWGIPYIVSENSGHYADNSLDAFNKRSKYYQASVRKVFRNADAITDVSFYNANLLRQLFGIGEISVIRNVVDTRLFYFADAPEKKFRFIHVSSLGYQKNTEGLLRAFHNLYSFNKSWELVLVGQMTGILQKLIRESGMQDVITCTGQIGYEEVARQVQHSSALVMFSRYENFPCVVIEALCCGLPVVSSSVAGIPEAVGHDNGILVESENKEQLVSALHKIMNEHSNYNRAQIALDAQSKYAYEIIGKQFVDVYENLALNK